jgi:predicted DsbA family dithiol-disulfide isomerase
MNAKIKITYYVEVISSWCYWAEPTWAELKKRYAGELEFAWKLALLDSRGLPLSAAQEDWFYRRSGMVVRSPFMLSSSWFDPNLKEYLAPNLVAEAGRDFGIEDDRIRLALAEAALREGAKVGDWHVSAAIAAKAGNLVPETLLKRAQHPDVEKRARAATAEFHALQVTQRPTFVIDDPIADRAVFSGLVKIEPLIAAIEAMRSDCAAYASFAAHFGNPPTS